MRTNYNHLTPAPAALRLSCVTGLNTETGVNMDKIDKQISEVKTMCCKADWYRKSRANFRCNKCEKDVTLEIMLLYQALSE